MKWSRTSRWVVVVDVRVVQIHADWWRAQSCQVVVLRVASLLDLLERCLRVLKVADIVGAADVLHRRADLLGGAPEQDGAVRDPVVERSAVLVVFAKSDDAGPAPSGLLYARGSRVRPVVALLAHLHWLLNTAKASK